MNNHLKQEPSCSPLKNLNNKLNFGPNGAKMKEK